MKIAASVHLPFSALLASGMGKPLRFASINRVGIPRRAFAQT